MRKKRAEWKIRLVRSNLKPSEGCLFPQVVLKGAYTLDDIIERLAKDQACGLNAEHFVMQLSLCLMKWKTACWTARRFICRWGY